MTATIRGVMVSSLKDLARLRADGLGLFGSGDQLFGNAIFGRDSASCAETLVRLRPGLAREILLSLARLQGTVEAPIGPQSNEEETGKIHHEHRKLFVAGRRVPPDSENRLRELASRWGGDATSLTYYGSVDATPLFVRAITAFCATHGDGILTEPVLRQDGSTIALRDSVLAAVDWLIRSMDASPLGFIEFRRRNPEGIPFQVWKDSGTSYIHLDGGIANWDAPIAAVEVQGYAYDALVGAARLFAIQDWRDRAEALRQRVIEQFWMQREEYFAMGLDRDGTGRLRWVDSIASNGALLLDTTIFDGLPDAERYIAAIVRRICGPDFVTEVGIRCRAANEAGLVDFQDYHGEWTVWMKETFDVVRGLERQGLAQLAQQLGNRLINAVNVARAHVEFLYVSPDQRVMYDFWGSDQRTSQPDEIAGTNRPEAPITWTVVAALALKSWLGSSDRLHGFDSAVACSSRWREALETEVLLGMPLVEILSTSVEIARAYERRGDFILNQGLGLERDKQARARRRGSELLLLGR